MLFRRSGLSFSTHSRILFSSEYFNYKIFIHEKCLENQNDKFQENLSRPGIIDARSRYRAAARRLRNTGVRHQKTWICSRDAVRTVNLTKNVFILAENWHNKNRTHKIWWSNVKCFPGFNNWKIYSNSINFIYFVNTFRFRVKRIAISCKQEDVRRYWVTLRKREGAGNLKRKH